MSGNSPHIIVTEVPPGFLKRRVIRTHFSRFGTIVRLSIQSSYCVITFENHKQASDAVIYGAEWKDMPMKIDFTPNHDPFGTDDAIIHEELNWFAEEPESSNKPKAKPLKSKFEGKFSDDPPKKIGRVDLTDDREEIKVGKNSKGRFSSTARFLEEVKSRPKQTDELKKNVDEEKGRSILRDERKGRSKLLENRGSSGISDEEGKISTKFNEDNKGKSLLKLSEEKTPKSLEEGKTLFRFSDEKKKERDSSPLLVENPRPEGRTLIRNFGEKKRERESSPMVIDSTESKSILKKPDLKSRESSPMIFENIKPEGKSVLKVFDDKKKEQESSSLLFDQKNKSEGKSLIRSFEESRKRESSPMVLDIQEAKSENKPLSRLTDDSKTFSSPMIVDSGKSESQPMFKISVDDRKRESSPKLLEFKRDEKKQLMKQDDENLFSKALEESKVVQKTEESKLLFKTTESPFYSKAAITLQEKLDILEERDKQLRQKPDNVGMETVLQGTCPDMCPEKERILRELRNMVAPYEALPDGRMDHNKAVKEYTRSSADQGKPLPHELRPEPVLSMTMSYLINCIISRIDEEEEENLHNWYDFCWGRLRAIRKDIIQQDLCDERTVNILEQCARFHIACYDRLWGLSKSLFDDKLNTETLNNCLTSLMKFYKDLSHEGVASPNEAEFNAYLILLNMNNGGFLVSRYQKYTKSLKDSPFIKQAVKIHLAYHNNMFSTYFKLTKNTSYLNACLALRFFQHVRTEALNTIIKSHCTPNKLSSISVKFLMDMLKLDSVEDCVNFCESTGLIYNEDENCFKIYRNDFYISEDIYKVETPPSLVVNKRIPITEAVVGSGCPLPVLLKHNVYESFSLDGFLKENAIDASDQEEKMLRDNVERKLLLSKINEALSQKQKEHITKTNKDISISDQGKIIKGEEEKSSRENEISLPSVTVTDSALPDNTITTSIDLQKKPTTSINTLPRFSPTNTTATDSTSFSFTSYDTSHAVSKPTTIFSSNSQQKKNANKTEPLPVLVNTFVTTFKTDNPPTPATGGFRFEASEAFKEIMPPKLGFSALQKPAESKTQIDSPSELRKSSDKENSIKLQETFSKKQTNQLKTPFPKKSSKKLEQSLSKDSQIREDRVDGPLKMKPPAKTYSRSSISAKGVTKWEKSFSKDTTMHKRGKKQADKSPSKPSLQFDKLRKKLSENMKKVAARKYLRIWKDKASKLRASKELETMVLYNMSAKDYIKLWGKPMLKRSLNLSKSLSTRKNSNLLVQMILHTDIINKLDKNVCKVGIAVVNALGETSVKKADSWGNIAQPNPVFWKLVFALPPPPEGGTTFGMKLRNWCKAAFYSKKDSQLSHAELHMSDSGVPVVISVHVVEGIEDLETCTNLSALVVVRARDWESTDATESRIEKLLSLSNNPIPVAVFNLGYHIDQINVNNSEKVNYFKQCLWENSKTTSEILCDLAYNVHLFNIKVKPFCTLIEISSEVLLDSLKQDSFLHDGLYVALKDPNNIIIIYNQLIDKIEQELIECKTGNYYGTAFEFKNDLEKYHNFFKFPDNYKDINFEKSLSLRCAKCKLQPLRTDFRTKKDVGSFFKNYCDDIGCINILRIILRCFNFSDEDSDVNISEHLTSIEWIPIIELIIKEILTSNLLTFKVAYRDDVIQNILQSRFWFESGVIKS